MAATITTTQVKTGFTTTVSDTEIDMLITFINTADECLDENTVPDNTVELMKLAAVRHMLTLQANNGAGLLHSQNAPSGAGRSFQRWNNGNNVGLDSTSYGAMLKTMDVYGCVTDLLNNSTKPRMHSIGCA